MVIVIEKYKLPSKSISNREDKPKILSIIENETQKKLSSGFSKSLFFCLWTVTHKICWAIVY